MVAETPSFDGVSQLKVPCDQLVAHRTIVTNGRKRNKMFHPRPSSQVEVPSPPPVDCSTHHARVRAYLLSSLPSSNMTSMALAPLLDASSILATASL